MCFNSKSCVFLDANCTGCGHDLSTIKEIMWQAVSNFPRAQDETQLTQANF